MKRGFTLIEVVLALGLTVIIGGVLAASLWAASKASKSADAVMEETRQTSTVGDIIAQELANAMPPPASTSSSSSTSTTAGTATGGISGLSNATATHTLAGPFIGTVDDIQFYMTGPETKATVQGDVRGIEYTTVSGTTNAPGLTLVRRVTSNLLAPVVVTPPDQPLCQGVLSIEFTYYDGTDWQVSWDSTQQNNALPMAVKFVLTLAPLKQGDASRTTTRIIPLSCYRQSTDTTGTTGGTQ